MAKYNRKLSTSNAASSARPQRSVSVVAGDAMEYRIARLFVWQGYFARRAREIFTAASLDRATDLDVLALRYRELFSRESIIVESKTGREGPLDRVFWLSGVKTFVEADRAFLFRKPTKWNIKDFAKQAGVEIIDLEWLEQLESAYLRDSRLWPGVCDPEFIRPRIGPWNDILRKNAKFQELYLTLSTEVRFDSPFAAVNFWVHHLRGLTRNWGTEAKEARDLAAFLIADAVGQLSVFLMRIAQFGADLRPDDRRGMVEKGLTYGELDPVLAKKVFDHAYRLSKATLREYLTRDVPLDQALFTIPRPDHVDVVAAAIDEIVSHSIQAMTFPQIADLVMAEGFLKGNRNQRLLRQIFPADGLAARVALVRNYLFALISIGALPDEVKQIFDTRQAEPSETTENATSQRAAAPILQATLFSSAEMQPRPDQSAKSESDNETTGRQPPDPHKSERAGESQEVDSKKAKLG